MAPAMVFFVLWSLLAFCTPLCHGGELWPEDIGRIKQRGKLVVAQFGGVRSGFFLFDDKGKCADLPACSCEGRRLVGCDIALASRIARSLGVKLELDRSARDFDSVCRNVALGKADIGISKLSVTVERAQYVRFTIPYAVLRTGILIDRLRVSKAKARDNVLEFCNRGDTAIGVIGRSAYLEFAREVFPGARLVFYKDIDPMLKGILSGEVHVLYGERLMFMEKLHNDPKLALRLRFAPVPNMEDHIAIAVSPRSPNLLAFINVLLRLNHVRRQTAQILKSLGPPGESQSEAAGETETWFSHHVPGEAAKEQP